MRLIYNSAKNAILYFSGNNILGLAFLASASECVVIFCRGDSRNGSAKFNQLWSVTRFVSIHDAKRLIYHIGRAKQRRYLKCHFSFGNAISFGESGHQLK